MARSRINCSPRKAFLSEEPFDCPFPSYGIDLRITRSELMYHRVLQEAMRAGTISYAAAVTLEFLMFKDGYILVD